MGGEPCRLWDSSAPGAASAAVLNTGRKYIACACNMLYVEVTRDDASARMAHPAPDIDIPAVEDAEQGYDQLEAEHLRMSPRGVRARGSRTLTSESAAICVTMLRPGTSSTRDAQALAVTHGPWRSCGRNRFQVACASGTSPSQYREVGGPQLARSSNPCLIWLTSPR
jgi:hypothetical protein